MKERMLTCLTIDYLQFTITSRAEMPNAEFAEEIGKAAEEFCELLAGSDPASNPSASRGKGRNFNAKL